MASVAQNALFDGTATDWAEYEPHTGSDTSSRRSISIFSRRGTDTPQPNPRVIVQGNMQTPKPMTERQKSWIRKNAVLTKSNSRSSRKPRGTVLKSVPSSKSTRLATLEEEMATSPNDEIMSAISTAPTTTTLATGVPGSSPALQDSSLWSKNPVTLIQRMRSDRRKEKDARIGLWMNGVVHWDDNAIHEGTGSDGTRLVEQTGLTPMRSMPPPLPMAPYAKPTLSLCIPENGPVVNEKTVSTIVQPTPQRPLSAAHANIVAKFYRSVPTFTTPEVHDVSPLEPSISTPPSKRAKAPLHNVVEEATFSPKTRSDSNASSSRSSVDNDDASEYSQRSSATSVEVTTPSVTVAKLEAKVRSAPDLNKPLPPSPNPTPPPKSLAQSLNAIRKQRSATVDLGNSIHPVYRPSGSPSLSSSPGYPVYAKDYLTVAKSESPTLSEAANDLEVHLSTISDSSTDSGNTSGGTADDSAASLLTTSYSNTESGDTSGELEAKTYESDYAHHRQSVLSMHSVHSVCTVQSIMQPPDRAPTVPKRSRRREWRATGNFRHHSQVQSTLRIRKRRSESDLAKPVELQVKFKDVPMLRKRSSAPQLRRATEFALTSSTSAKQSTPDDLATLVLDDGLIVVNGPVDIEHKVDPEAYVSSASAEDVLLHILSALTSTQDLFNTALINKGMYRVYKENEMDLIKSVSFNQSPAAWEFREWSPPESSSDEESAETPIQPEHTPLSYMHSHRHDFAVIESLKKLILEHCQTFIRGETTLALSRRTHSSTQRIDDALWRIWCFCKIFGCGKGREEDVTGQLDWLKGGLLANNQDLTATMNMNLDYDMATVLLNPPEHFAKGNGKNGLSAQQLYDMTEIWSCLSTILQGFHHRTEQARRYGVFDACDVEPGHVYQEEQMLEEWTAHLLMLGPAVVLEMAAFAHDKSSAGFAVAKANGWTKWSPTHCGDSRTTFLKEPVSRLYEERVGAAALKLQHPKEQERKEVSRKRVANLAAEIKLARQSSFYRKLPLIDMNNERPMSQFSRRASTMSVCSLSSCRTPVPARMSSTPYYTRRPATLSVPRPMSPASTLSPTRAISPINEDNAEYFNRLSLKHLGSGVAEETKELAVKRISDMGFTKGQAYEALRVTDTGYGVRVDRAVDMLLKQRR